MNAALQSVTKSVPKTWRERTPEPADYYGAHVENLTTANALGWAQATCPLHRDRNLSLSVRLDHSRGAWRCEVCGGGDMVGFHMRLRRIDFPTAVLELVRHATPRGAV